MREVYIVKSAKNREPKQETPGRHLDHGRSLDGAVCLLHAVPKPFEM
jgi:hypothetical protein